MEHIDPQFDEVRDQLLDGTIRVEHNFNIRLDLPDRSDAVPYVDALYQAWLPSGRLDPATHVLTVLSLRNRAIAVHPGTVDSALSKPFQANVRPGQLFSPQQSAGYLVEVLLSLTPEHSGRVLAWDNQPIAP